MEKENLPEPKEYIIWQRTLVTRPGTSARWGAAMHSSRRTFICLSFPLAVAAVEATAQRRPRFHFPDSTSSSQASPATGDRDKSPRADPRLLLQQNQDEIRKEVLHLYDLAVELKTETDKTDSTGVLSLPVLKKADEIQKIAKRIHSLARG